MKLTARHVTYVFFLLALLSGTWGCNTDALLPTPPASNYPADIIGKVTVADAVLVLDTNGNKQQSSPLTPGRKYWLIHVAVKNKDYPLPISAFPVASTNVSPNIVWVLMKDGKPWSGLQLQSTATEIAAGKSGDLWLSFVSESDFNPSDLQICYQGQEPYSYGSLIAGGSATVFDWTTKRKINTASQTQKPVDIATVQRIWVSAIWAGGGRLSVELVPNSTAVADKAYTVELYQQGRFLDKTAVSWTQPEINDREIKTVQFSAPLADSEAYAGIDDLSHMFSVKLFN